MDSKKETDKPGTLGKWGEKKRVVGIPEADPPDGGWGWFVVTGAIIILILCQMMAPSFGIMFSTMLRANKVSSTAISWIFNTQGVMWNVAQLFAGPLTEVFSWRSVAIFGSLLTAASIVSSAFATSGAFLYFTFTFLGGIGPGLSTAVCFFITPKYFSKRRGTAMSVMLLGSCLGQFLCPIAISYLQETYGFFGATLILGGIALNMVVGSALFRPLHDTGQRSPLDKNYIIDQTPDEDIFLMEKSKFSEKTTPVEIRISTSESIKRSVSTVGKLTWMNLKMIQSLRAIVLATGISVYYTGFYNFNMMVAFSLQSDGYTLEEAAWCTSVSGIGNLIGRTLVLIANSWPKFNKKLGFLFSKFCLIVGTVGFAITTSYSLSVTFMSIAGFGIGVMISLYPLVLIDVMDMSLYTQTYGFASIFIAFSSVTIGPLAGFIRDYTESYKTTILVISGLMTLAFILWLFLPFAIKYDEGRNRKSRNCEDVVT